MNNNGRRKVCVVLVDRANYGRLKPVMSAIAAHPKLELQVLAAEPWRVKFSYQDETRFDYWKPMKFTESQWLGLKQHAEEPKSLFLSSHFSIALWCLPSDIWFEISEVRNPESPIYKSL